MKIVIFGGHGFMGVALARALLEEGHEVSCFGTRVVSPERPLPDGVNDFLGDVTSPTQIVHCLAQIGTIDVIYWLAAKQGYDSELYDFGNVNVGGIYSLFRALLLYAHEMPRIVLASSQAVYTPGLCRIENEPTDPPSVYGLSKLQQERAFLWFCKDRKIEHVVLRYSIILGGGQSLQSTESGIMRNWIRAFNAGEAPSIYGDGSQCRDFVHIDDVTRANVLAIDLQSGTYNVGGFAHMVRDVAKVFQDISGCKKPIITGEDFRPGGEYHLTSVSKKIGLNVCLWKPEKDIEVQIADFVKHAKKPAKTEMELK